ncbi:MAG: alpha/beta hydrolase [Pyrinomonadaceae bacterium]
MYPAGNLYVPVSHGRLEAILKETRDPARGVALVLHPHPLGGGTMHNKVVFRAAAALNEVGLSTLRLNFRGVGQSSGEHDEGRGELEDVRAGVSYLEENYPQLPVTLCGFSFGARVGLEVGVVDERVANLISIGTPVSKYNFSFIEACRKPILFVHGAEDEFGAAAEIEQLARQLGRVTDVEVKIIPGADHFFAGHLDELKQALTEWMTKQLSTTA